MAHTAFNTKAGLLKWLQERGLEIDGELPERGEWAVFKIKGAYYSHMTMDVREFEDVRDLDDTAKQTKVLSNGEYTLGVLTKRDDGLVVVHYLNPNVDRQVFDYAGSREVCEPFVERAQADRPRG
jgi:hypothetical protein